MLEGLHAVLNVSVACCTRKPCALPAAESYTEAAYSEQQYRIQATRAATPCACDARSRCKSIKETLIYGE